MVARGKLHIGAGARVLGSAKSNKEMIVEAGASVEGSLISAATMKSVRVAAWGPNPGGARNGDRIRHGVRRLARMPTTVSALTIELRRRPGLTGRFGLGTKGGWFSKDEKAGNYRVLVVLFVAALVGLLLWRSRGRDPSSSESDRLLLVVPDGTDFSDPHVTIWTDAASEEGLHIVPIHDSTFLQPLFGRPPCAS